MTHEIDTDGGDVGLGVGIVGKSQQQTRLSNTGISDEEELEKIIVSGGKLVSSDKAHRDGSRVSGRFVVRTRLEKLYSDSQPREDSGQEVYRKGGGVLLRVHGCGYSRLLRWK